MPAIGAGMCACRYGSWNRSRVSMHREVGCLSKPVLIRSCVGMGKKIGQVSDVLWLTFAE